MRLETLLAGYVLRVAVCRNRWRIMLIQVSTGEQKVFDSFEQLGAYLERHAIHLSQLHRCEPND